MNIDKHNVLIMVPAFNEEESVGTVLVELRNHGYDVVLISDGSTDGTSRIGHQIGVSVLSLPINLGVGGALRTGFRFALRHGYEAVIQVDADGQHPVSEIERLIETANETNADMVIGSRFMVGEPKMHVSSLRRVVMKVLARSASAAAERPITDSTSGFRVIKRPLLDEFSKNFATNYLGDTYEAVVSAGRAGYSIVEIPANLEDRKIGESTASTGSAVRFTLKGLGVALLGLHRKLNPR